MAHQEYPKWLYHATAPARIVDNAEDHRALPPGWFASPGEAQAGAAAAPVNPAEPAAPAASTAPVVPVPPVETAEDVVAREAAEVASRDRAEAESLYTAAVPVVVEKIKGASAEILQRVRAFESENPNHPGGRKGILEAVDKALAALPKG